MNQAFLVNESWAATRWRTIRLFSFSSQKFFRSFSESYHPIYPVPELTYGGVLFCCAHLCRNCEALLQEVIQLRQLVLLIYAGCLNELDDYPSYQVDQGCLALRFCSWKESIPISFGRRLLNVLLSGFVYLKRNRKKITNCYVSKIFGILT